MYLAPDTPSLWLISVLLSQIINGLNLVPLKAKKWEVEGSLEPTITVKQADKKGMEFEGMEAIAWAEKSML